MTILEEFISSSIVYGIFLVVTLLYARRTHVSNYQMGIHSNYLAKSLIIGVFATSGYLLIALIFRMPLTYTSLLDVIILLFLTLIIGLVEETIFRGYIQANLVGPMPRLLGVIITAILFAALHIPSYIFSGIYLGLLGTPLIFFIGWILGYLRINTGNIWAVVVAHMTWDFYTFIFTPQPINSLSDLIPVLLGTGFMWITLIVAN
jgi:membrane protease YdiL (CAAX protease family)